MSLPSIKKLNDRISYIPASEEPLSSHVGIVNGDSAIYLYDVGATFQTLEFLHSLDANKPVSGDIISLLRKPYDITVSHFHGDHAWWLEKHYEGESGVKPGDTISLNYVRPRYRNLYVSKESAKHTCRYEGDSSRDVVLSNVTSERVVIEDGVRIEIIPIPSTHAKGCLAMMVDDEYLFVGDATYGAMKDGAVLFNAQLLKAQMELIEELPAKKILLSHDDKFVRPKAVVLRQLEAVYEKRSKDDPYIRVS